jgi:hypothetical protein
MLKFLLSQWSRRPGAPVAASVPWRIFCAVIPFWSSFSCVLAQEIPAGFQIERYSRLWERNPFAPLAPAAPKAQPSAFDKLFLASWLRDGGKDVIFVQNSETNEVQRITTGPNHNNLCLIEMHLNLNPQLVEAVISDGKEQGAVKFRFDGQSPGGQTASGTAQMGNNGAAGQTPNPGKALPRPLANLAAAQNPGLRATVPVNQAFASRLYPGIPRVHTEGGSGQQAPQPQGLGVKRILPGPAAAQSNSKQN